MDIKLRARLSAYSKVDSIHSEHEYVSPEQIDKLFEDTDMPISVTKTEIDGLFEDVENPESVSKTEIDTLFDETDDNITSVSFDEIDSLFKK